MRAIGQEALPLSVSFDVATERANDYRYCGSEPADLRALKELQIHNVVISLGQVRIPKGLYCAVVCRVSATLNETHFPHGTDGGSVNGIRREQTTGAEEARPVGVATGPMQHSDRDAPGAADAGSGR